MTKNVLFYARYATHRQSQVSIKTQTELGEAFVKARGWKLVAIYSDTAVSGTGYQVRPGIQSLMTHAKRERIDIVLCMTIGHLSRDIEHRVGLLKELRYRDVDIWTVDAGVPVIDLDMALSEALGHELADHIPKLLREGVETTASKGKTSSYPARSP